jgi:phage portal protein BeeE
VGLLERVAAARNGGEERQGAISIYDWAKLFRPGAQVAYQGNTYQAWQVNAGPTSPGAGYYESNSVVFACELNRILLFSEARFQYQQLRNGRPGDLFGNQDLAVLEEPWVGATTRDLLARAELDVACYGNSYWVNDGPYLQRLDPAKVSVLTEKATDRVLTGYEIGERLLAYAYRPDRDTVVTYQPDEIAHYKPIPDRTNPFIGMSWLNPCLPDIDADQQMTAHKQTAISTGTSIPYVVTFDKDITDEQFDKFVEEYRQQHEGPQNAGKTLFIGIGADIKTTGQTFEQLSLKATQGAGETRIAACSGVPPVIVGLSEGLGSATYSNYSQARRRLVDGTMRPLWGAFAGAFRYVVKVPAASRLWYDDRDIPFLREDVRDQAEIFAADASALRTLIESGWEPEAGVEALVAKDFNRLRGRHTGLTSVQLQPPMTAVPLPLPGLEPASNGNGGQ